MALPKMMALTAGPVEKMFQMIEAFFATLKSCCMAGNGVAKRGKTAQPDFFQADGR
jgi:hypothetical protein